jgi:hypothetical protein
VSDYEYKATLDLTQIKKSLEQITREFAQMEKRASGALDKIQKQAEEAAKATQRTGEAASKASRAITDGGKQSGAAIGAVAGGVAELTRRFIDMGLAAARALLGVVEGGVALNANLETVERTFAAAFGSPELGKEAVKFLDEIADKLNIDKGLAREFGQSILPKTDSLENFTELLRLVDIQSDSTGKSMDDLKRAIRDALSGDFASIRDQFDLGPEAIEQIKALTPTLGAAGALAKVVGDEFAKLGKVNISGTLQTDVKAINSQFTDLQAALGKPVFDELKQQVADLGGVLSDREDDFALMAGAAGDMVANVVDFVGSGLSDFLRDLDTETVIDIANNLNGMVESGRQLVDVLGLMELPDALVSGISDITGKLDDALTTAAQLTGLAKAEAARRRAEADTFLEETPFSSNPVTRFLATTGIGLAEGLGVPTENDAERKAAGEKAYQESILETARALELSKKREEEVAETQRKRREEQGKETPADQGALNAVLAQQQAEEEAAKAAQVLADAQAKVNEKMNDLKTDQSRAELDLLVKAERAALDAALDAARRREDLARANLQKIADIETKNNQAIADAAKDLSRDEEDIARDSARAQVDATRQAAQRRLDIETQYRRRLQDIQRQFAESALEAERTRDAVSFLAAQRERASAIAEAGTERGRGLADVGTEEQRAKEAARIAAEEARQEAAIENQRKLEDLNTRLQQELEAQRINNEQSIEEARIAEERKQQDLEASLAGELATIAQAQAAHTQAEQAKTQATQAELQKRLAATQKAVQQMERLERQGRAGEGSIRASAPGLGGGGNKSFGFIGHRADGGPVDAGQPVWVGERGRELLVPNVNSYVIPNRIASRVPAPVGSMTSIRNDNSTNINAPVDMLDPTKFSAAQRAILRNEVAQMMADSQARARRAGAR